MLYWLIISKLLRFRGIFGPISTMFLTETAQTAQKQHTAQTIIYKSVSRDGVLFVLFFTEKTYLLKYSFFFAHITTFLYLCGNKTYRKQNAPNHTTMEKNTSNTTDKAALFREKAARYLTCFNDHCPRHDQCLRWEVGRHTDPAQHLSTSIPPTYAPAADGSCPYFRDNSLQRMPLGMTHFYDEMPGRTERGIKNTLIAHTCRATYYKYHRGDRPITPDMLMLISEVCRRHGWTQPLRFDAETEDYVW